MCVCVSCSVMSDSLRPHGLQPTRFLCPGNNTGMGCHSLLQRIFPTQGSNPDFLHHRQILYYLSYLGRPEYIGAQKEFTELKCVDVPGQSEPSSLLHYLQMYLFSPGIQVSWNGCHLECANLCIQGKLCMGSGSALHIPEIQVGTLRCESPHQVPLNKQVWDQHPAYIRMSTLN